MKMFKKIVLFSALMILFLQNKAFANIAPLKIVQDGVEPLENPGIMIESGNIEVKPSGEGFKFSCNYVLKGLKDIDSLTIGVPGDLGYTLEAGYIDNINIYVNGNLIECKIYNTTEHLSDTWKKYNSPLHFKWHTFSIPVKKDEKINLYITYNMLWRIVEQNKSTPYHIVPFLLSTDKLFGNDVGKTEIKFVNDDKISLPDVKVMINSMLESDIISSAILSPKWDDYQIIWEFKDVKEFQDFRLIALSFKKLAMEFSTDTDIDQSIRWAVLNNNYERLATIFENIAKRNIKTDLNNDDLGTAAYISAEFYFRLKNYDKAIDMLSLPYKTMLWPINIKHEYINAVKLEDEKKYKELLDTLEKLVNYKDYILLSKYSEDKILPIATILAKQAAEEAPFEYKKVQKKNDYVVINILLYGIPAAVIILFIIYFINRHQN